MNLSIENFQQVMSGFAHLFYPQLCAGCGGEIQNENKILCVRCLHMLPVTSYHLHAGNPVEKIFWGRIPVHAAASHAYFTKNSVIQVLLHALKYRSKKEIGIFFGERIGTEFLNSHRFAQIDAIVPVPLHPHKKRKRGYNQAEIIGEGIKNILQIPILTDILYRSGSTDTQTNKNRVQRWDNISGKFRITNTERIAGLHLLLVDDVVTTGATLEACANALLQISGTSVSMATVAYAYR